MKTLEKKLPIWIDLRKLIRSPKKREDCDLDFIEVVRYPDGQVDVMLSMDYELEDKEPAAFYLAVDATLASWEDLQIIACVNSVISRKYPDYKKVLNLRYLIGARSDRRFSKDGTHYLRDIIAPIINHFGFDEVRLFDPHSDVSLGVIEKSINDISLYRNFLDHVFFQLREVDKKIVIVTPDAGAYKKVNSQIGKELLIKRELEVVSCYKSRDLKTGEITGIDVPKYDWEGKKVLIIDDICDGGRTFIELGEALGKAGANDINLCVTHGIFSKGVEVLEPYFKSIFTSDSFSPKVHPLLKVIELERIRG
jgi:ribose-phosphate pyrophosphokinase